MAESQNRQQRLQAHLTRVLQEMQQAQQGTKSRQELIRRIENLDPAEPRRLLVYVANTDHPPALSALQRLFRLAMRSRRWARSRTLIS
jgi:hypothetical protein